MENRLGQKLFTCKKRLQMSDTARQQNRLRLMKEEVENELLPKLTPYEKMMMRSDGLKVQMIDEDSGREYDIRLGVWNSGKCYVLKGAGWSRYVLDSKVTTDDVVEVSAFRSFVTETED